MERRKTSFEGILAEDYAKADPKKCTDVRWWMASGMHTNETIIQELNAMHNAGFSGVELCQLYDTNINETVYGYGSAQWENDVKLILNTALDLGMSVSLTTGAGWCSANVPGLDPDSEQANQCVVLVTEEICAGCIRRGSLPASANLRPKARFLGAFALRKAGKLVYEAKGYVPLTSLIKDNTLTWTAPDDGDYTIMYYYTQGCAQSVHPAAQTSYTVNYFDRRGVEALKTYLEKNVLNDDVLNKKIMAGNVQCFMDSLEYTCGTGFTSWTENFAEEFSRRKGYDILPFLFLAKDAPNTSIWDWEDNADLQGIYSLTDLNMTKRILNDIYDVQTKLYMEEFITPLCQWLHTKGITLRAQISYGKNLEISEPIAVVDHPEAENRNQKNQVDMYRLWSGGAHLLNKILSAETGGLDNSNYSYTYQRHLQEAYLLYSTGFSRLIWHIWAAEYGPTPIWPGYEGSHWTDIFYKFGTREPSYSEYSLFNSHLGRVQNFLQQGKAGIDLGMIYTKYGQHMVYGNEKDWLHTHHPMFFPSVVLQDNGYTYDYLNPTLLDADNVAFDCESKTLELAGYKALVLWQDVLSIRGAKRIYELAVSGLPVVIVDGAANTSPYWGESDSELKTIMQQLKKIPHVRSVACADDVISALLDLGITPYIGFTSANQQLLTQTRRVGNHRYLLAYNYCDGSLHDACNLNHGSSIATELVADGYFVPYSIDPWTGCVNRITARYADGKTFYSIDLNYGDIALFALEAIDTPPVDAFAVPQIAFLESYPITDWELTVEAWLPTDEIKTRTETLLGVTTQEYAYVTKKQKICTTMHLPISWDEHPDIGKNVSGKGFYRAMFFWDGKADGAYLDFGQIIQSMRVRINGTETDPINMNVPRVEITRLLQLGENTIEVTYSSNLNNLQLSRGKVKEHILVNDFPGYLTKYEKYGFQKAIIIPYVFND